jgi:outer membrane protein assembly factor BamB
MDYESRKVKWYALFLFLIYCSAAVYVLFQGNPYLYSHLELRSAMLSGAEQQLSTIPSAPRTQAKLGQPTYYARYNFERTGVDPLGSPRSRTYEEYEKFPVELGLKNFEPTNIVFDRSGFYITGRSEWVVAVGLDGKALWKYKFANVPAEKGLLPPLVDEAQVYVVHPQGEVVAFNKENGEVNWLLPLNAELTATPFIWNDQLVLPVKGTTAQQLVLINRQTGARTEKMPKLEIKPGFHVSRAPVLGDLIATVDNKVVAINPNTWAIDWSQTLTDPVKGAAVVVENQIFVATLGAKIIKLEGNKKGKVDWEVDLEKPAASPPTILPIMHRLSFLDTSGALNVVDAKTGKAMWRYGIENKNVLTETWSARLKGNNIEEFKMDWLHKGWTIWSPCSDRRFCIYTPNKGQMIARIQLSGEPMTYPLVLDKKYIFFLKGRNGQYLVSHVLDETDTKAAHKAAGKDTE